MVEKGNQRQAPILGSILRQAQVAVDSLLDQFQCHIGHVQSKIKRSILSTSLVNHFKPHSQQLGCVHGFWRSGGTLCHFGKAVCAANTSPFLFNLFFCFCFFLFELRLCGQSRAAAPRLQSFCESGVGHASCWTPMSQIPARTPWIGELDGSEPCQKQGPFFCTEPGQKYKSHGSTGLFR